MPEHDGVTFDIDPAPPRATGQLGVLPRRDVSVGLAVELHQLLQHHRPGGHVDAQRQCLGSEDNLDQPADEGLLDALLERGQHAGVMCGHAHAESLSEAVVVERLQIAVRESGDVPLDDRSDLLLARRGW